MKPNSFILILILMLFSLGHLVIAPFSSVGGQSDLSIGLVGVFASNVLFVQNKEIKQLKSELALLNKKES